MCIRLFPDIIVAAEIASYVNSGLRTGFRLSVNDLILHQKDYAYFGFESPSCVFVGYEGKEWGHDDYGWYLSSLPQFFREVVRNQLYDVNEDAILKSKDGIHALLTRGTYPSKVLYALGIR